MYLKQKWLLFNVITNMSGMALLSMNYVMIYKCICLHICTCVHVGIYICSGGSNIEDPPFFSSERFAKIRYKCSILLWVWSTFEIWKEKLIVGPFWKPKLIWILMNLNSTLKNSYVSPSGVTKTCCVTVNIVCGSGGRGGSR